MTLNINQFAQTPVQGQMDLQFHGSVISAQVDAAQVADLVAGQPVKMATTAGGVPKFIALAANTDKTFGFVARNLKDLTFPANAAFELAIKDSVQYMTAGGAITRGGNVEVVYTTTKVIASAGVNPVVGFALDTAAADGDLIRVYIVTPVLSATIAADQTIIVTATLAQINAGFTLIPGQTGQAITVTNFTQRVNGASFAGGTNVKLQSSNGTPVVVATTVDAGLVSGAVLTPADANTTLGAGFGAALGSGDGLKTISTGTQTTATGITYTITYRQA